MEFKDKDQFRLRLIKDLCDLKQGLFSDIAEESAVFALSSALKSRLYGVAKMLRATFAKDIDFRVVVVPFYLRLVAEEKALDHQALQRACSDFLPAFNDGENKIGFIVSLTQELIMKIGVPLEESPPFACIEKIENLGFQSDETIRSLLTEALGAMYQKQLGQAVKAPVATYMN